MTSDVSSDSHKSIEPLSWSQAHNVARDDPEPSFDRDGVLRWSSVVVAALLLAGLAAGVLWSRLSEPPGFTVRADGASMGEAAAGQQFGVEVVYAGLAVAFGLALGALAGARLSRYGWVLVCALGLGSSGAAVLSLAIGRWLGPPDPAGVVTNAPRGAVVPMQLDVASTGVLLLWPVAALAGFLAVVALSGRRGRIAPLAPAAPPSTPHPDARIQNPSGR